MEAGRELDAAVAERVMGWQRELVDSDYGDESFWNWVDRDGVGQYECSGYDGWQPSTDIAAAMEVVEKMRGDAFEVSLFCEERSTKWNVTFDRIDAIEGRSDSNSLPEAICRAALQATKSSDSEQRSEVTA